MVKLIYRNKNKLVNNLQARVIRTSPLQCHYSIYTEVATVDKLGKKRLSFCHYAALRSKELS